MMTRWKQALRSLLRRPGFSLLAVLILAAGIAADTGVFSIVDAVVLKPLPYPNSDRLVTVFEASSAKSEKTSLLAPVRLEDWNRMNRTFESIAGSYFENVTDISGDEPERLIGRRVSPRYFSVFESKAVIGRTLTPEEEVQGGPLSIVISHGLWTRRYHQSPDAIGRRVILKGQGNPPENRAFTIVAVMPPEFAAPEIDVWIPAQLAPFMMQLRDARFYSGVGRLKPGITVAQGQEDLARVQRELGQQFPQTDKDWSASVQGLKEARIGSYRDPLLFILIAVSLLLLIAVANIAGLMLSQLQTRERELAIRTSIGATRVQVVGAVLREVLLIAFFGVAVGYLLDVWLLRILSSLFHTLPRSIEIALDWRALAFASFAGAASAIVSGIWPAVRSTRSDSAGVLSHGTRSLADGSRSQRFLVATQFALAVVLLSTTGLVLRSYYNLQHVEIGFDAGHQLTFHVGAAWSENRDRLGQIQTRLIDRLEKIPGVVAAGFSNFLPASDATLRYQMQLQEVARSEDTGKISAGERGIAGDYLKALNAPIIAGDSCPPLAKISDEFRSDPTIGQPKALVNRRFAELYSKGRNLVGMHFHLNEDRPGSPATEIVGIVGDVREDNLRSAPVPYFYSCIAPGGWPDPEYVVRAQGDPRGLIQAVRQAIHEVDPSRAIFGMTTLQDEIDSMLDQTRLQTGMISAFGIAAVTLAAIGLYGLVTLAVTARTKEIGIRLALGANPTRIVREVMKRVGLLLLFGTFGGLILTFIAQRELQSIVFGVSALDVVTLGGMLLVLIIPAAVATLIPARRAAKLDPLIAIRE
jgi:putative ABC transport system permease protein